MIVDLEENDRISRCVIYKKAFDATQMHVDEYLWRFGKTHDDGASHESAVLRRLAPITADVHRIGCNIASKQNRTRDSPAPGDKRRYYCGYRTACYGDLPKKGDGFNVRFVHKPEDGENSHLDVAVVVDQGGQNAKALWRTNAGMALAERFGPTFPYICACDISDDLHPVNRFGFACLGKVAAGEED